MSRPLPSAWAVVPWDVGAMDLGAVPLETWLAEQGEEDVSDAPTVRVRMAPVETVPGAREHGSMDWVDARLSEGVAR